MLRVFFLKLSFIVIPLALVIGFFEYNLIQIRFLSAGLLLSLPIVLILAATYFPLKTIAAKRKTIESIIGSITGILIGFWVPFLFMFFPYIPQYLGGAKPIPVSFIGTPAQIKFLENFDVPSIENGEKESVQTFPVCLIYQNDQYVLFFTANQESIISQDSDADNYQFLIKTRALLLSRSEYLGLQNMSGEYANFQCRANNYLSLKRW